MQIYNSRTKHTESYYEAVLVNLILCRKQGFTKAQVGQYMESIGLRTPTGSESWSIATVNGIQARLRLGTGHLYNAALKLLFAGKLTKPDVQLLTGNM